jgi:hypothetical protein
MFRGTVRVVRSAGALAFAILGVAGLAWATEHRAALGTSAACNVSRGPVGAVGVMLLGIAIIVIALRHHRR